MTENTRLIINRILSILTGVIVGVIVISIIEMISSSMYPFPENVDTKDRDIFNVYMSNLPKLAFIIVLLGHALGALAAGFIASKMARIQKKSAAVFSGLILLVATILNIVSFYHPIWFSVIDVVLYVPMALVGFNIQSRIWETK
jgi:hypothetical protein